MRRTTVTSVHECTGNGRRFFDAQQAQPASGTQWSLGAVGTVRWEGVRLRDVLAAVGLDAAAVVDPGHRPRRSRMPRAESTTAACVGPSRSPRHWTTRSSPGEPTAQPLLPDHGFPLRLVLPGWVGIASIKWLGSLEVSTSELTSPWNTKWYRMTGGDFPADSPPLTVNPVRSAWELAWAATLPARPVRLTGRSWSGAAPIVRVEVSTDGGTSWRRAVLDRSRRQEQGWTRWSFLWAKPQRGTHELLARATDAAGRTQPAVAAYNDGGYFFDAVVRHPVTVV